MLLGKILFHYYKLTWWYKLLYKFLPKRFSACEKNVREENV